jgi:hypothetical protein
MEEKEFGNYIYKFNPKGMPSGTFTKTYGFQIINKETENQVAYYKITMSDYCQDQNDWKQLVKDRGRFYAGILCNYGLPIVHMLLFSKIEENVEVTVTKTDEDMPKITMVIDRV